MPDGRPNRVGYTLSLFEFLGGYEHRTLRGRALCIGTGKLSPLVPDNLCNQFSCIFYLLIIGTLSAVYRRRPLARSSGTTSTSFKSAKNQARIAAGVRASCGGNLPSTTKIPNTPAPI